MRRVLPFLLVLAGCPADETPPPTTPGGVPGGEGAPGGVPAANPGGGAPVDGGAAAGAVPPAGGGQLPVLTVDPGNAVAVSGTVAFDGAVDGAVRLDITTPKDKNSTNVVHAVTLDKLGPFKVELPKNYGKVTFNAFIDKTGDGPSPGEPAGSLEATVGDAPLTGLVLTLTQTSDKGQDPNQPGAQAAPAGAAGGVDPNAAPQPAGTDAPPAGGAAGAGKSDAAGAKADGGGTKPDAGAAKKPN